MAVVKRPKLNDQMMAARMRDEAITAAQKVALENGVRFSAYEKKFARDAKWERRGKEMHYYSQSGQGLPPWEQSLQRWALAIAVLGIVAVSLWKAL